MPDRFWKFLFGPLAVAVAAGTGTAAAQDYSAGKTPAQLFQSDCTACHKGPGGLAKGMDRGSLTRFLREHYTTKEESAVALAAYLLGAGPGEARQNAQGAAPGAKPTRTRNAEAEPDAKPAPRPRAAPPRPPEGVSDTATLREEPAKPAARSPAAPHEGSMESKLKFYGSAGGSAHDTERLATPSTKLDSSATSGSPADAVAPDVKPKPAAERKNAATAASATAPHGPRRPRAPAPVTAAPTGNN